MRNPPGVHTIERGTYLAMPCYGAGYNLCMILRRLRSYYALILVIFYRAFDALHANN